MFVVGIRTPTKIVKAFDICVKGHDVYANYTDCSTPEAHSSYHASGQCHMKVGKQYVQWDGGPTGGMEPMKLFRTRPALVCGRSVCWTVGWEVGRLDSVLPELKENADMLVSACDLDPSLVLGFEASVIGDDAKPKTSIVGYPIVASQQFGNGLLRCEVHAFVLSEEQNTQSDDF
jgi:hypothetical protein